ncbi:hypothetical protein CRYUN_Cryun30bG0010300 [Craigia yunnanensis]
MITNVGGAGSIQSVYIKGSKTGRLAMSRYWEPTGNQMPISMANHCRSRSPLLMEGLEYFLTLCQQIGGLARLSLAKNNSKLLKALEQTIAEEAINSPPLAVFAEDKSYPELEEMETAFGIIINLP